MACFTLTQNDYSGSIPLLTHPGGVCMDHVSFMNPMDSIGTEPHHETFLSDCSLVGNSIDEAKQHESLITEADAMIHSLEEGEVSPKSAFRPLTSKMARVRFEDQHSEPKFTHERDKARFETCKAQEKENKFVLNQALPTNSNAREVQFDLSFQQSTRKSVDIAPEDLLKETKRTHNMHHLHLSTPSSLKSDDNQINRGQNTLLPSCSEIDPMIFDVCSHFASLPIVFDDVIFLAIFFSSH